MHDALAPPGARERRSNARFPGLILTALRVLVVRLMGPASAFLVAVMLARLMGPAASGEFYAALTLVTGLATLAKLGMDTALQRFIGAASGNGDMPLVAGIYRQAQQITLVLSLSLAAILILLAEPLAALALNGGQAAGTLRILGLFIVPYTLLGVKAAALKALGRPVWGGFFEVTAMPMATLPLVFTQAGAQLNPAAIAVAHLLGACLVLLLACWVLRKSLGRSLPRVAMSYRRMFATCLPLTATEVANFALLWTPFLLLPALSGGEQAGLYNISHRVAAQLGLLMVVFASITAPSFASFYEAERGVALTRLASMSTRSMFLCGMLPGVILLYWSEWFLALLGEEYVAAAECLQILVLAHLFRLAMGPVGYLMAVTGREKLLRNLSSISLLLMLAVSLVMIPAFGAIGAAVTIALSMVLQSLACTWLASRYLRQPLFLLFSR